MLALDGKTGTGSAWGKFTSGTWWEDSSPVVGCIIEGLAVASGGDCSFSLLGTEGAFGCVENTRNCGRPWAADLPRCPSLLAIWCVRPIAAAAARCWIMRSSSSTSFTPTGNCKKFFMMNKFILMSTQKNANLDFLPTCCNSNSPSAGWWKMVAFRVWLDLTFLSRSTPANNSWLPPSALQINMKWRN